MPVKKRIDKRIAHRVTDAAVDAFVAGDTVALLRALGLPPWSPSPLETHTPEPPAYAAGSAYAEVWPLVWELRLEIEARP